jgi:hypothetical protein
MSAPVFSWMFMIVHVCSRMFTYVHVCLRMFTYVHVKSRRFVLYYKHKLFEKGTLMQNPFTPSFGKIPAYLAGREYLEIEILDALENGSGNPSQTSLFVGARGTGKTAMLGYLALKAQERGWVTASTTATSGMLEDILQQAARNTKHLLEKNNEKKISGVSISVAGFGAQATWDNQAEATPNWRTRITNLLDKLEEQNLGLLITVDEVDPRLDEMIQLITVYQHLVVEERKVALLMAGLPHKVSGLISSESVSFLRRASRKEMGNIPDYEIEQAFRITAEIGGKTFASDALAQAVSCAKGFPYMMQLIGYRSWASANGAKIIKQKDVKQGIDLATADMRERVLRSTLNELSEKDLAFCAAMLKDKNGSVSADIGKRLNASSSSVSTYKRRLLDGGIIQMVNRTRFDFALPLLREYLPEYLEENGYILE